MKIGIAIEETWDFLHEIYADLTKHHEVTLFERRTMNVPLFNERASRYLFNRDFKQFLSQNEVVFFEWASELLIAASHFPKTCGIVTRLHRYEMYQWVDKVNWDAVDRIILVSEAKMREFEARFPNQAEKIIVVSEAVSLEKFQLQSKSFSGDIGILCHITPRKRVYELILTFFELLRTGNKFRLHIGGGSKSAYIDYYNAVHTLVKKLNLQDKVVFYDHVNNPQDWYHNIDILISNSYSEGLQVSPMEAMASGCYCLSHHWDGADELLPIENLYLTNAELIEKILQYSNASESERQTLRKRMRSIVDEKFNVDKTKIQIRNLIEQVEVDKI